MSSTSRRPHSILSHLNKSLECGICFRLEELRELPCQHLICLECLESILGTVLKNGTRFECPFCRETLRLLPSKYPVCRLANQFQDQIQSMRDALDSHESGNSDQLVQSKKLPKPLPRNHTLKRCGTVYANTGTTSDERSDEERHRSISSSAEEVVVESPLRKSPSLNRPDHQETEQISGQAATNAPLSVQLEPTQSEESRELVDQSSGPPVEEHQGADRRSGDPAKRKSLENRKNRNKMFQSVYEEYTDSETDEETDKPVVPERLSAKAPEQLSKMVDLKGLLCISLKHLIDETFQKDPVIDKRRSGCSKRD